MPANKAADETQAIELARLKAEVGFYKDQVKDLETKLDEANKGTTRYQVGLQRAVAELNRCSANNRARVSESRPELLRPLPDQGPVAQPSRPSRSPARVITLNLPEVTPLGDDVLVSAHLWNSGGETARGTAAITLSLDGQTIDTATVPFTADPGVDAGIQHRFNSPGEGMLAATIHLDY